MRNFRPQKQGIELKKKHGQHFLKDQMYIIPMLDAVQLNSSLSVLEIGCGDGILTHAILQGPCKQLKVFEIDQEWAHHVKTKYGSDVRLHIINKNILDLDWSTLQNEQPWVLLANLPYQITFPILHLVHKNREMFVEGVVMVQEEVAQKIVQKSGRGYGYSSLFFQHFFDWKLLTKVPPDAFYPAPKVFSRLLYFKPKKEVAIIENEEEFWKFVKLCFHQPRRTLKNNLMQLHYHLHKFDEVLLQKRAQQLSMQDFLSIWKFLQNS
ncbi:ribosomal RNA small subunit methyltransferase A [Candidatus Dependentiae bacterium]|nr:ribosomal RNA small subunit methyltransferase A [Candidatus Dependentiae bacterium]